MDLIEPDRSSRPLAWLLGWVAGLLMKGRGFGLLGDIVIGIIGR